MSIRVLFFVLQFGQSLSCAAALLRTRCSHAERLLFADLEAQMGLQLSSAASSRFHLNTTLLQAILADCQGFKRTHSRLSAQLQTQSNRLIDALLRKCRLLLAEAADHLRYVKLHVQVRP
jgi:hypothetical protein